MAMPSRCAFDLSSNISNDPYARRECARSGTGRERTADRCHKQRNERALFDSSRGALEIIKRVHN